MPTRTRTIDTVSTQPGYLFTGTQKYLPNGAPQPYNSSSAYIISHTAGYEGQMTDVTGNYGKTNNCTHTKWELINSSPATRTDLKSTQFVSNGWGINYDSVTLTPSPAIEWGKNQCASGMSNIEGLKTLAISRIPRYATRQLMGAVSLVELGDTFGIVSSGVRRLVARLIKAKHYADTAKALGITTRGHQSTWNQFSTRLRQDVNRWWNQNRELVSGDTLLGKDQLKKLLPMSINADLWWKFGLRPFIQDVQAVQKALRDVDRIVSSLSKGMRVYGRATDEWSSSLVSNTTSVYPGIGQMKTTCRFRTKRTVVASVHRVVKDSYRTNWLNGVGATAVLADSLGLIIGPEDVWETTRYSFMIDWIFNVQSILESARGYNVNSDMFVDTDPTVSVKMVTAQTWVPNWTLLPGWEAPGSSTLKTYERTKQSLAGQAVAYVPPLKLPSFEQWFTGLEILVQHMIFPKGVTTARRG